MRIAGKYFSKIVPGTQIEHQFRKAMVGVEFKWHALVVEVKEDKNEIDMHVISDNGHMHLETWNLAHTQSGLERGEYLEIQE